MAKLNFRIRPCLALGWFAAWAWARSAAALEGPARLEPGLANRADVPLYSDFEDAMWWKAWGERRLPSNSVPVEGPASWGGSGKSLQVTIPKDRHDGCSLTFRFKPRTGSEPEEIYLRYYVKIDPDWKNSTDGGKFPGFGGTYGRAGWGGRPVDGSDGWSARGAFLETQDLAEDQFARTQLADPEEGCNRVARARESLQRK